MILISYIPKYICPYPMLLLLYILPCVGWGKGEKELFKIDMMHDEVLVTPLS